MDKRPFALLNTSAGKRLRDEACEIVDVLKNHAGPIYSCPVYLGRYTGGDEW